MTLITTCERLYSTWPAKTLATNSIIISGQRSETQRAKPQRGKVSGGRGFLDRGILLDCKGRRIGLILQELELLWK